MNRISTDNYTIFSIKIVYDDNTRKYLEHNNLEELLDDFKGKFKYLERAKLISMTVYKNPEDYRADRGFE
ncbi:MAG: hypothetical protein BAJALOKI3v1_50061 [Promethearchaeota archaeon]|nr:MAG: hypothetical protein BAJALOKI3v1_50061 [Candidatus Lokiarchaeota archaeon]